MKAVGESRQNRPKSQLARLMHPDFGTYVVYSSFTTLKNVKPSTINYITLSDPLCSERTSSNAKNIPLSQIAFPTAYSSDLASNDY